MTIRPTPATTPAARRRSVTLALLGLALVGVAACGTAAASDEPVPRDDAPIESPGSGRCAPDVTDCDDVVDTGDEFPSDQARADAESLLGLAEGEFGDEARIARKGNVHFLLTEDYVLGRLTVELDDDGSGTYRVVSVTVELPDGPETISA